MVKSVAKKIQESLVPGGMNYEALQGWLLKFGEDRKNICISVEVFFDWFANNNSNWSDYYEFMSGHLMDLEKQPGVHLVGIRETRRLLFAKCVLNFMGPKSTNAFKDDHLCAGLKVGIDKALHGVQAIWDSNLSTEN